MQNLLTLVQRKLIIKIIEDIVSLESRDQFDFTNVLLILHKYKAEIEKTEEQVMIDECSD